MEFVKSIKRKMGTPRFANSDGIAELDEYIEQASKNLEWERGLRAKNANCKVS